MATLNNYHHVLASHKQTKPIKSRNPLLLLSSSKLFYKPRNTYKQYPLVKSVAEDKEVVTEKISVVVEHEKDEENRDEDEDVVVRNGFVGKVINACIVLGFGTLGVTRLLTIDHEYWHGLFGSAFGDNFSSYCDCKT
nr:protein SYM-1 like [Tanacetum cinerariifolium]